MDHYLSNKKGCDKKTRVEILNAIFDPGEGLISNISQLDYLIHFNHFTADYGEYFTAPVLLKLKSKILDEIILPKAINKTLQLPWLSNIVESINANYKKII